MKRYVILAVLLTGLAGCAGNSKPYTCFNIDSMENENPVISVGDIFCIANNDFQHMDKQGYHASDINIFLLYNTKDPDTKCSFYDQSSSSDYFTLLSGTKVDPAAHVYACPTGTVNVFENKVREKLQKAEEQKKQENTKSLEKKLGKKLCSYDDLPENPFHVSDGAPTLGYMGNSALRNCAFQLGAFFSVLNQTDSGTLITVHAEYSRNFGNGIYFISKNSTDSKLVDDQRVEDGYFERIGTFQYTAVSGAKKTVLKLKRLSKSDLIEHLD